MWTRWNGTRGIGHTFSISRDAAQEEEELVPIRQVAKRPVLTDDFEGFIDVGIVNLKLAVHPRDKSIRIVEEGASGPIEARSSTVILSASHFKIAALS